MSSGKGKLKIKKPQVIHLLESGTLKEWTLDKKDCSYVPVSVPLPDQSVLCAILVSMLTIRISNPLPN